MSHIVVGGAGFIGSNLVSKLCAHSEVVVIDNFSNGEESYLTHLKSTGRVSIYNCDLSTEKAVYEFSRDFSENKFTHIWQLAANSNIQRGNREPFVDFKETLGTTIASISIADIFKIPNFIFASSSAVYGDRGSEALDESNTTYDPLSNYGVMKLASEHAIAAWQRYSKCFVRIYRFPNVIGLPLTHGVIHDLLLKMRQNDDQIEVLGDGFQQKPFLHVSDLIENIFELNSTSDKFQTFNLGPLDDGITIRELAEMLKNQFAPNCELVFGAEPQGWFGDVPRYSLNVCKAMNAGATKAPSSREAVARVIKEIALVQ